MCYDSYREKKGVARVKKIVSVMLVCVLIVGIMPFASAEVGRVTPARCPVCSDALIYRTYTVALGGNGCHTTATYRQAYCPQHGDVYGAEELSTMDYGHDWVSDYQYGGVICRACGKRGTVTVNNIECPGESEFHRWATNHLNGSAQCIMCDLYWHAPLDEPLSKEDVVCPSHRTFHTWSVDAETGDITCETCGEIGLEIVVID